MRNPFVMAAFLLGAFAYLASQNIAGGMIGQACIAQGGSFSYTWTGKPDCVLTHK